MSASGLILGKLVKEAKVLIMEAEQCVLKGEDSLLPVGWADSILSLTDEADARIRNEQVLEYGQETHQQIRDTWSIAEAWWHSRQGVSYSSAMGSYNPVDDGDDACTNVTGRADYGRNSADSDILAELGNHQTRTEQKYFLAGSRTKLDEIQDEVHALLSVVTMQIIEFRSLKPRKISELAWFSVLEEEAGILTDLHHQIQDLYDPPDDMGEESAYDFLHKRFDALPVQLQAIFNMHYQEKEQEGREIGDEEMLRTVLENQKRTGILRSIQHVIDKTQEILHEMEKIGRK